VFVERDAAAPIVILLVRVGQTAVPLNAIPFRALSAAAVLARVARTTAWTSARCHIVRASMVFGATHNDVTGRIGFRDGRNKPQSSSRSAF